ncbi:uncharacterized protein LOC124798733 [Schistocerca piceifrons]|uniref:uncharacterized protein LOC124798733 n=1 Tax=Schistocerca piceifrons TaxID=274613 RepID=UPI001F5F9CC5|nr:uncharacterized protein LOC124798733 [Schistocerca piceifrons]
MWRLQRHPLQVCVWRWAATTAACLLVALQAEEAEARATKRSVTDTSVMGYLTERTCWWNEICKEEFQTLFRCKCPVWSFCRSPGRYYNAFCTMTGTGYIWTQPEPSWGRRQSAPGADFDAAEGGDPQQRARCPPTPHHSSPSVTLPTALCSAGKHGQVAGGRRTGRTTMLLMQGAH